MFAWVWPKPPDKEGFVNQPRFSTLNLIKEPIPEGGEVVAYHCAQNFTRMYGSIACDQALEAIFTFSNDEVTPDGDYITDENMKTLHYDAEALKLAYEPSKQSATGKYLVTIYGRFLSVRIKNVGTKPIEWIRFYVRGSVF